MFLLLLHSPNKAADFHIMCFTDSTNISIWKVMHFLFLDFSHQQPHGPTCKGNPFVSDMFFISQYSQSSFLSLAPFLNLSSTVFISAMIYINKFCNSFTVYFHFFFFFYPLLGHKFFLALPWWFRTLYFFLCPCRFDIIKHDFLRAFLKVKIKKTPKINKNKIK